MINKLIYKLSNVLANIARPIINTKIKDLELKAKYSSECKIAQINLINSYQYLKKINKLPDIKNVGFRNFSQFDEDGILLYIFSIIGAQNKTFIDIGSSDGINSNCANFAINHGWHGLFIDGNDKTINFGKKFYQQHPDTNLYPPKFICSFVQKENINQIIKKANFNREIDLLSIDIDGNDYWIWKALDCVSPMVVIIETNIEFGTQSIVVPYDKNHIYPGKHPQYIGASVKAMIKLAHKKGYRLVATNLYGFNTIYIKKGIGEKYLPEITYKDVLKHPRNKERFKLFKAIKNYKYLKV